MIQQTNPQTAGSKLHVVEEGFIAVPLTRKLTEEDFQGHVKYNDEHPEWVSLFRQKDAGDLVYFSKYDVMNHQFKEDSTERARIFTEPNLKSPWVLIKKDSFNVPRKYLYPEEY